MIRRIAKNNDLLDIIKGYPEGVLNNIHTLKYYTYGNEDYAISVDFDLKGDVIEAVLPAEDLISLPDGVFYRKAYYSDVDERFPDQSYDLEIVDCMDIWLYGDGPEDSEA